MRTRILLAWAWLATPLAACTRAPPPVELRGIVTTASGLPVAGAIVVETRTGFGVGPVVVTGPDGSFAFDLRKGCTYALTTTSETGTAAYRPPSPLDSKPASVVLTLGDKNQGFVVSGRVIAAAPLPADSIVKATGENNGVEGDVFVARVDAAGRYSLRLPRALASQYTLGIRASGAQGLPARIDELKDQLKDLDMYLPAPLAPAVVAWVKETALPLSTVEAGHRSDDLVAVGRLIGDARVVGLGEATHGTREFFRLKDRLFEYLVKEKGFRAIAFEAGRAEARRVNDYVLQGRGNAAEALAGLRYWTWNTEEVLAMVEWMRAYNADEKKTTKVQFFGFDMELTALAAANVQAYLDQVDLVFARARPAALGVFAHDTDSAWATLSAEARAEAGTAAHATVVELDTKRDAYVKVTSADRWRQVRDDAHAIEQWAMVHARDTAPGDFDYALRDAAMAENVDEILAHAGARSRIVLWAHNGHVGRKLPQVTMGEILHERYADQYVGIGLLFGQGGFQAHGTESSPHGEALQNFELGPAPEPDVTSPLSRAGLALSMLDLRHLPDGAVHDWFAMPHPVRDIGVRFSGDGSSSAMQVVARHYDAVAFVATTTPARPNVSARKGR